MWSNLNEYCLSHIFSYLQPHDWINVAEVCQLWRKVVSREWKQITEIDNLKDCFEYEGEGIYCKDDTIRKGTVISAKDAKKIVFNSAPYIKVLKAYNKKHKHFLFGNVCYKVEGRFEADIILEFLILGRATKVINVSYNILPKAELMRLFLFANNVKVLNYRYSEEHHQQLPACGIEELLLNVSRGFYGRTPFQVKSFEGHFPNLKSLTAVFTFAHEDNPNEIISNVLPYFRGVKCLNVIFECLCHCVTPHEILKRILLHWQLEELQVKMRFENFITDAPDTPDAFLSGLRACCPRLRILNIDFETAFNEFSLLSVMSLPDLERLTIGDVPFDLLPMAFPEMKKLEYFHIILPADDPSVAGISDAVAKMPKLKTIVIKFKDYGEYNFLSKRHQVQLICNLALAVLSQGKNVLVTNRMPYKKRRTLHIRKKVDRHACELVDDKRQTVHFASEFEHEKESYEGAREFLRHELHGYDILISYENK